ncbi:ABC transporter permease [Mesorhizobium sp. IMUNJ 23033]|uniref:ABC transporter permease n=1 Tax=Mesorhizobium sp. IMUNJ 23033 TaxID=3378039 RepID=UPI00384CB00D
MRTADAPYWSFAWVATAIIAFLYVVPMAGLVLASFGIPGEPGFSAYVDLLQSPAVRNVVWVTFRVSVLTTVISVALGYVLALSIIHLDGGARSILLALVVIPFWLSALVRALAWLILLRNNGLANETLLALGVISEPLRLARNELGVLIAMVHFCVPFATFPLLGAMTAIDSRHVMAGRSLGASQARIWRDIYLPLTMPSLVAAAFLVFVLCLGFFVTPAIVGGGRVVMLSEYISFSVLVTLRWTAAAALSVGILLATLAFVAIVARLIGFRRMMEVG